MKTEYVLTERNGIPYLTTPDFLCHPRLAAGFATRQGGVSAGQYAEMNFGFSRGDNPAHVLENYERFAAALGASPEGIACVRQIHSDIVQVCPRDGHANPHNGIRLAPGDGVVTAQPGIYPVCYFADCMPLLLYAPDKGVTAAVHSGWRGTEARILAKAIGIMAEFGCDPGEMLLAIGPSIGAQNFEVGQDVADRFAAAFPGNPEIVIPGEPRPHVDLWRAAEATALSCGLNAHHITCLGICNMQQPEAFFSHRLHGERRGVLMALIGLRPEGA